MPKALFYLRYSFWHGKNLRIKNSVVKGEYLSWMMKMQQRKYILWSTAAVMAVNEIASQDYNMIDTPYLIGYIIIKE